MEKGAKTFSYWPNAVSGSLNHIFGIISSKCNVEFSRKFSFEPSQSAKYEIKNSFGSLNPDSICVGAPDNDDADTLTQSSNNMCPGDSGGPLICPIKGKATLIGATSL